MRWRNTQRGYGIVAVTLHWVTALCVAGLFLLGLWMVDLTYYDAWYRRAPAIHKSTGILLAFVVILRLGWRLLNPSPRAEPNHARWERRVATLTHRMLYALLFAVASAGYLISTADGRPVDVFGWFSIPAVISGIPNQEDVAGDLHLMLAIALITLSGIHALAAFKHHFMDRDRTLVKMLGRANRER